jgi:hypothetical protein
MAENLFRRDSRGCWHERLLNSHARLTGVPLIYPDHIEVLGVHTIVLRLIPPTSTKAVMTMLYCAAPRYALIAVVS